MNEYYRIIIELCPGEEEEKSTLHSSGKELRLRLCASGGVVIIRISCRPASTYQHNNLFIVPVGGISFHPPELKH